MENERIFTAFVSTENNEKLFNLLEYDTVGTLKEQIEREFGIPKSRMILTGWTVPPDSDNDVLGNCADMKEITILHVTEREWENIPQRVTTREEEIELQTCINFIKEVVNNVSENRVTFHVDLLENKVKEVCLGPLEERKVLLLYLHDQSDEFSAKFWENLKRPEIIEILNQSCCIIGWDITKKEHHSALISALEKCELSPIVPYIGRNVCTAICIVTEEIGDKEIVNIKYVLNKNTSDANFLAFLLKAKECQIKVEPTIPKIVINSKSIQQNYADLLGDRDYDSYEFNEHEHLEKTITYAIYGPPTSESGYSDKIKKESEKLFIKIVNKSNEFAENKDKVEMATIYNCTEPLEEVKIKRKKEHPDYDPDADVTPYPVFILRKCRDSENPCRIFIDHSGRVYKTWEEYLEENKLPKCLMNVPKDGRYEVDQKENVILERRFSPACGVGTQVLNTLDVASAVGGLTSGGIGVATTVLSGTAVVASTPLLAAALPVVGIAALTTGAVVGIYSLVRSSMTIQDRILREESVNFLESPEARGAYLNIVAGSLGFVGAGTNVVFSQLISRGVQLGTGAQMAVNTINFVNLGAGGVSVANSVHDVIHDYVVNNEPPSALTILQLSSNVLFFGHAVFSFRTAGTIIEETQTRILKDYNDSLRSNRHRKTFNRVVKSTINNNEGNVVRGRAEVIASLRNIQNKDETFAALTRNLKRLKEKNVQVFAKDGNIQFNGIAIDMNEFCSQKGKEVYAYLSQLSTRTEVTPNEVSSVQNIFSSNNIEMPNVHDVAMYAAKFLINYPGSIKEKIIGAFAALLKWIIGPTLDTLSEMIPLKSIHFELFSVVIKFFSKAVDELETQYQQWKQTKSEKDYNPLFDHVNVEKARRYIEFMEKSVTICFELRYMKEEALRRLLGYFCEWFAQKYTDYHEEQERRKNRRVHSLEEGYSSIRKPCKVCKGYYFQKA